MDEDSDVETTGCCSCFRRRKNNREAQDGEKKGWCFSLSKDGRQMLIVDIREFCLAQWFIPVSVGFTVALNVDKTVEQFVASWIMPLIGIFAGEHHDDLVFTVRGAKFTYGTFIDSLLNTGKRLFI